MYGPMILSKMGFFVYISAWHHALNKHVFHSVMKLTNCQYFFVIEVIAFIQEPVTIECFMLLIYLVLVSP